MSDEETKAMQEAWAPIRKAEKDLVRSVGERIGYGNTMALCEELWGDRLEAQGLPRGGAHSHYCCATFLVPCPGCPDEDGKSCDWCCGAGRVTQRVAEAIRAELGTSMRSCTCGAIALTVPNGSVGVRHADECELMKTSTFTTGPSGG